MCLFGSKSGDFQHTTCFSLVTTSPSFHLLQPIAFLSHLACAGSPDPSSSSWALPPLPTEHLQSNGFRYYLYVLKTLELVTPVWSWDAGITELQTCINSYSMPVCMCGIPPDELTVFTEHVTSAVFILTVDGNFNFPVSRVKNLDVTVVSFFTPNPIPSHL